MYIDPQKLPGIVPGDPHRPIPVLSNHTHDSGDSKTKRKQKERTPSGFFSHLLPRPFTRALETLFGGRRRGELSGKGGDAEFFGPQGPLGEVWDDEMSSSMLGNRLRKVVQNYQVRFAQNTSNEKEKPYGSNETISTVSTVRLLV